LYDSNTPVFNMLKYTFYVILFSITLSFASGVFAQEEKMSLPYGNSLTRDTIPDLSFKPDSTLKKAKKKKQKRNLFYGKKSRKGYTRTGVGTKQTVELFYVLRKYVEPSSYVDELYIWDISKAQVVKVRKEDLKKYPKFKVLHGPYTKYIAGRMVENGIFYVGTKHGRWEKYKWEKKWWEPKPENKYVKVETLLPILTGKAKYYKGFQREAKITYYDFERTKIKEVEPFEFGEKTGAYYYFLEDGRLLVRGQYEGGKKVGLWIEYFEKINKRMRETQYPKDQWEEAEPVIMKEWDSKGNLIISGGKEIDKSQKIETDPIKKSLRKKK